MKFPSWLRVYGDTSFRGNCPPESAEQITFFNMLRDRYPETYGAIALHPKNEAKRRTVAQQRELDRDKAGGMAIGAPDIIIPMGFACELKRLDHTRCKWQPGQLEYLEALHNLGGFACVALGHESAMTAFESWRLWHKEP